MQDFCTRRDDAPKTHDTVCPSPCGSLTVPAPPSPHPPSSCRKTHIPRLVDQLHDDSLAGRGNSASASSNGAVGTAASHRCMGGLVPGAGETAVVVGEPSARAAKELWRMWPEIVSSGRNVFREEVRELVRKRLCVPPCVPFFFHPAK